MLKLVVASAEEMTADWFDLALNQAGVLGGARVTDVRFEAVGGGLMARMMRASLTYDAQTDAPDSVIVKFPTDDPGSLGLAQAMGFYEQEVRFYQDLAPLLSGMSIPRCYLASIDDDAQRFTLVLEDLSTTTRPGDVLTQSTVDECAAALEQLARFQAPLWNSTAAIGLPWLADPARTFAIFDGLGAGLEPFIARFGASLEPEHVTLFEAVVPRAGEWARNWTAPTVVQHGDFRSDNLMFGATAGAAPVTVIDFQTLRLGPPGVDPAYFLGSSLSTETRRDVERGLVTGYHEHLIARGVTDFDFDDCWTAYRQGALYGVCLFVGMASQVESTERGDRVIVDQIRRYAEMAIDLDAQAAAGLA